MHMHFPILCIPNARFTTIRHGKATQEDTHNQNTPIYLKLTIYTDLSGCSGHPTVRHASEACQSAQQAPGQTD